MRESALSFTEKGGMNPFYEAVNRQNTVSDDTTNDSH